MTKQMKKQHKLKTITAKNQETLNKAQKIYVPTIQLLEKNFPLRKNNYTDNISIYLFYNLDTITIKNPLHTNYHKFDSQYNLKPNSTLFICNKYEIENIINILCYKYMIIEEIKNHIKQIQIRTGLNKTQLQKYLIQEKLFILTKKIKNEKPILLYQILPEYTSIQEFFTKKTKIITK